MHEPETSKWREPGEIDDLAAEGESESLNLEKVQRSQTCRFFCAFSSRKEQMMTRDRRELSEFQGEGDVIHDQQDRTDTRSMERNVLSDGG